MNFRPTSVVSEQSMDKAFILKIREFHLNDSLNNVQMRTRAHLRRKISFISPKLKQKVILMEMDFSIIEHNIKDKPSSLKSIFSEGKVKDSLFSCKYTINLENDEITISGNSEKEILDCANSIIRTINRSQNWNYSYNLHMTRKDYGGSARTSIGVGRSVIIPKDKNFLLNEIKTEYKLPAFLDLLFQEAIFNMSARKHRVAFILAFSAIERAVKLLCEYHCKVSINRKSIVTLLSKLKEDDDIQLKVNVTDFNRFNEIRNDIAHGDTNYKDRDIKEDVVNLFNKIDEIFRHLSPFLEKNKQYI